MKQHKRLSGIERRWFLGNVGIITLLTIACVLAVITMTDAAGVRRAAGKQAAMINKIVQDMIQNGGDLPNETLKELLTLDAKSWRENCAGIREYFEQFGDKLPHELREELEALEKAFAE